MCHRFIPLTSDELEEALAALEESGRALVPSLRGVSERADVWPGRAASVLVPAGSHFEIQQLTWGFDPPWGGKLVFNTRIETALSQTGGGMWGDILAHGRCLVPTMGFYEHHRALKAIDPLTGRSVRSQVRFAMAGSRAYLMAGVYRDGRFSVVTTAPNADVAPVHDRMPLVLGKGESDVWLNGSTEDLGRLADRGAIRLVAQPDA